MTKKKSDPSDLAQYACPGTVCILPETEEFQLVDPSTGDGSDDVEILSFAEAEAAGLLTE